MRSTASGTHTDEQNEGGQETEGPKSVTAAATLPTSSTTIRCTKPFNFPQSQSKEKGEKKEPQIDFCSLVLLISFKKGWAKWQGGKTCLARQPKQLTSG